MTRRTVVYATTRGWNIGDDFIRIGCENLVESLLPQHNRLIYDKAIHVRQLSGDPWERHEFHGNSYDPVKHKGLKPDFMVVAGTPENCTERALRFFSCRGVPAVALALGDQPSSFSDKAIGAYASCKAITVRSPDLLNGYRKLFGDRVQFLPCTSLLSSPGSGKVLDGKVARVGLGWKCPTGKACECNDLHPECYRRMVELYCGLMRARSGLDYGLILHHVDEIQDARSVFPGLPWRIGYDEREYTGIYSKYDFVVTPRVHGCGKAASLYIPSALVRINDPRSDTVKGFMSPVVEDLDSLLAAMDCAAETSKSLAGLVDRTFSDYLKLLQRSGCSWSA